MTIAAEAEVITLAEMCFGPGRDLDKWDFYLRVEELVNSRKITCKQVGALADIPADVVRMRLHGLRSMR